MVVGIHRYTLASEQFRCGRPKGLSIMTSTIDAEIKCHSTKGFKNTPVTDNVIVSALSSIIIYQFLADQSLNVLSCEIYDLFLLYILLQI